jgi:hypothetical protein
MPNPHFECSICISIYIEHNILRNAIINISYLGSRSISATVYMHCDAVAAIDQ